MTNKIDFKTVGQMLTQIKKKIQLNIHMQTDIMFFLQTATTNSIQNMIGGEMGIKSNIQTIVIACF